MAIVGSGFSGLGMALRLREAEIEDVVLERADDVGGTRRDNSYLGWAATCPRTCTRSRSPRMRTGRARSRRSRRSGNTCATAGALPGHGARWLRPRAARRELGRRRAALAPSDVARRPHCARARAGDRGAQRGPDPDLPGLERFEGATFHSATWDHDHDHDGERVTVIGSGAAAIQFVHRSSRAWGRLHVFQCTTPWIMPRPDRPLTGWERRLYRALPGAQLLMRAGNY